MPSKTYQFSIRFKLNTKDNKEYLKLLDTFNLSDTNIGIHFLSKENPIKPIPESQFVMTFPDEETKNLFRLITNHLIFDVVDPYVL
jgi:hypothetical protein